MKICKALSHWNPVELRPIEKVEFELWKGKRTQLPGSRDQALKEAPLNAKVAVLPLGHLVAPVGGVPNVYDQARKQLHYRLESLKSRLRSATCRHEVDQQEISGPLQFKVLAILTNYDSETGVILAEEDEIVSV